MELYTVWPFVTTFTFGVLFPGFNHVVTHIALLSSIILHCMDIKPLLSIHLLMNKYLGCFNFLAMNNAAMNIYVHKLLY